MCYLWDYLTVETTSKILQICLNCLHCFRMAAFLVSDSSDGEDFEGFVVSPEEKASYKVWTKKRRASVAFDDHSDSEDNVSGDEDDDDDDEEDDEDDYDDDYESAEEEDEGNEGERCMYVETQVRLYMQPLLNSRSVLVDEFWEMPKA